MITIWMTKTSTPTSPLTSAYWQYLHDLSFHCDTLHTSEHRLQQLDNSRDREWHYIETLPRIFRSPLQGTVCNCPSQHFQPLSHTTTSSNNLKKQSTTILVPPNITIPPPLPFPKTTSTHTNGIPISISNTTSIITSTTTIKTEQNGKIGM